MVLGATQTLLPAPTHHFLEIIILSENLNYSAYSRAELCKVTLREKNGFKLRPLVKKLLTFKGVKISKIKVSSSIKDSGFFFYFGT